MNDRDPGGLLVVLVICHYVSTLKAKIETARLVKENGCGVDASVWCKAEVKSMAVTL